MNGQGDVDEEEYGKKAEVGGAGPWAGVFPSVG